MTRHTIEAVEKPVLDLFCDKYLFRIPTYQRPYAWTTEQTSELLDDITTACGTTGDVANQSPYFLSLTGRLPIFPTSGSIRMLGHA